MKEGRGQKALILLGAYAMIGVFAWVDSLTGAEVRSVMFYLLPIVIVAWTMRYSWVLLTSLVSSLAWTVVAFYTKEYSHPSIALWNEATALVVFVVIGVAISTVRRERDLLKTANTRIQGLLENEQKIARTDPLTGLPNSREFMERLEPELARSRRAGSPLAVMYIDLDNFKLVNDRYGHAAGDALLKDIAEAMKKSLRGSDVAARLGGDEFAVLLWQPERAGSEQIGHRVLAALREAASEYADCDVGASIGIAWFASPPSQPSEIMQLADEAMYQAKEAGKNQVVVTEPETKQETAG